MSHPNTCGTHTISNLQQLERLTSDFSHQLHSGDIVLLHGDLGAGKTTFAQFLGKAVGVQEEITSPTYTILAEYMVSKNPEIQKFIHLDLYRSNLNTNYVQDILQTAEEQKAVVVIEWAETLETKPIGRCWDVSFTSGQNSSERIIDITLL